jgi:hypothetical protein
LLPPNAEPQPATASTAPTATRAHDVHGCRRTRFASDMIDLS